MKKRLRLMLLALLLALAALCVGASAEGARGEYVSEGAADCTDESCIAHTEVPGQPGEVWRYHFKSLDEIQTEMNKWHPADYPTIHVKFCRDVELTKTFTFNLCNTHVILDLNGHTISGNLDKPMIEVDFVYGQTPGNGVTVLHCIAFQNGTIKNTGAGAALQLSGGAVTLEKVNVTGDLALAYNFAGRSNSYTPTFLGGGTFTRICGVEKDPEDVWIRELGTMLGKGCYFIDSSSKRIDAEKNIGTSSNANIKELTNIKVMACDHKDDAGEYTFEKAATKYGAPAMQCTVCGNLCPHDEISTDGKNTCTVCGLPMTVKATNQANGTNYGPYYYTGFDDAMYEIQRVHSGICPTITLLADAGATNSVTWWKGSDRGLTIDLAGHDLTLSSNKTTGWVTFKNTSDTHANVTGTVNVAAPDAIVGSATLTVPETNNDLTIGEVKIGERGTASLAGGSFGTITVPDGKTLASLLADGYCYYVGSENYTACTGGTATLGEGLSELTNVYVAECDHSGTATVCTGSGSSRKWTCPCGEKTFRARVTANGATQYCETVQAAFDAAADGGTVGLLDFNTAEAQEISTGKNLTIELVGSVSPNSLRFRFSGNVTFLSAGLNGSSAAFSPFVVVENGGTLTVPEYYDSGTTTANAIRFANIVVQGTATLSGGAYSMLTVDGGTVNLSGSGVRVNSQLSVQNGGKLNADGAQIDWFNVSGDTSTATVTGSAIEQLTVKNGGTATLTNCTVKSNSPTSSGSTVNGGSLTVNGSDSEIKDLTVKNGDVTATGGMLTGTLTVDGGTVNVTNAGVKKATINDGSFTLGKDGVFDENELRICGGEAIIDAGDKGGIKDNTFCDVIVEGGKLTLKSGEIGCITDIRSGAQAALNGGNFGIVWVGGKLTVNDAVQKKYKTDSYIEISRGGEAELLSGSCDQIIVRGGKLTVSDGDGSCNTLDVAAYCWDNVTLSGGSFGEIWVRAYEVLEDQTVKKLDDIGYAQYAAMLDTGKGYQKSDSTFAGTADVTEDVYANPDYPYKVLQNVTVANAPFTGLTVTGDSSVTYGDFVMLTASIPNAPEGVTYQWYRNGTAIENATDASYTTDTALNVGSYTYTVEAAYNGYVAGASYTVTVEPKVIYPILDDSKLSKVYDGTAIADVVITGFSFDIGSKTPDPSIGQVGYEITDPHYEDYNGTRTANVADARMAVYTLTLNETNYALGKDYDTGAFFRTETNHVEVGDKAITQANIGEDSVISAKTLTILNRHQKTYEIDLTQYLPTLTASCDYGGVTYAIEQVAIGRYYSDGPSPAAVSGSTLTLPVVYMDSDDAGSVGEIQLTVHSTNYEDFILIIKVDASNKILPTGTVTPSRTTLTYGEKLSAIVLTGEMKEGGTVVDGTLQWDLPNEVLDAGEHTVRWTFLPTKDETYLEVRGIIKITVTPANLTGKPEIGLITGSGKTFADVSATKSDGWPDGSFSWFDKDGNAMAGTDPVKANTVYKWVFTPDSKNYNSIEGSVTLYSVSIGGGSYTPTYPVNTPSKTENGNVTVTPRYAERGETVTITVKPDEGFELDDLTVTDKNGNDLRLTDKGSGKYTFTMPAGKVEVKATFTKGTKISPFDDVPTNAYYYEAVKWAQEKGITDGIGNGLFGSDQPCTRAQIVTFLWRAAGSPEPKGAASSMTDVVSGSYYEKAVAWAIENGVTTGTTTTTFSPDATCTRAQAVTFLARALNAKATSTAEFSDVPTDSYFAEAVAWAAANGVTTGIGGGLFGPNNNCTRAQIVTFLWRAYTK